MDCQNPDLYHYIFSGSIFPRQFCQFFVKSSDSPNLQGFQGSILNDIQKIDPKLYPSKLSQVDKGLAKQLAVSGLEDGSEEDDHSDVKKNSMPANTLKTTQSTMDLGKFVGMAIQMMGKIGKFSSGAGGDLGAIISSDATVMSS